jgi:hypothetical protein
LIAEKTLPLSITIEIIINVIFEMKNRERSPMYIYTQKLTPLSALKQAIVSKRH